MKNARDLFSFNLREKPLLPATLINILVVCFIEMFILSKGIDIPTSLSISIFAVTQAIILYAVYTNADIYIALSITTLYTLGLNIQFLLITDSDILTFQSCFEETMVAMILGLCCAAALLFISKKLLSCFSQKQVQWCLVAILFITIAMAGVLYLFPATHGTHSWLKLGSFQFQLTELHKPLFIVYAALLFNSSMNKKAIWSCAYILFAVLSLGICGELGTALIIVISWIIVNFIFIDDKKEVLFAIGSIVSAGGLGFGILALAAKISSSSQNAPKIIDFMASQFNKVLGRIQDVSDLEPGSQAMLGYRAIIRGGWLGNEEIIHIPEERYDYTFCALLLRMGIVFGIVVILLFGLMIWRSVRIYEYSDKHNSSLNNKMAFSSAVVIFVSAMISICGNTRALPLTGVVLPFIASGASAGLVNWLMFTLVIYNTRNKVPKLSVEKQPEANNNNIKVDTHR